MVLEVGSSTVGSSNVGSGIARFDPRGFGRGVVRFGAIGRGAEKVEELLRREWREGMSVEEGEELGRKCVGVALGESEGGDDYDDDDDDEYYKDHDVIIDLL